MPRSTIISGPRLTDSTSLEDAIALGVEHCRAGSWELGMSYLAQVAEKHPEKTNLPSVFYSYLGLGVAQKDGKLSDGLRLCEHALKLEFYEVDNYLNLARVLLLMNERERAVETVKKGLAIEPENSGLLILHQQLGKRRKPPLRFLSRKNPLNVLLGRVIHALDNS